MFEEHIVEPSPYVEALKDHWRAALRVAAAVLVLAGAAALLSRQYEASAVVAVNAPALSRAGEAHRDVAEVAWGALSDGQISAIISQFQLDHGMAHLRAHGHIFTYVRSRISLTPTSAAGAPQVIVSYLGEDPSSAMGVANAVAQQMSRAAAPAPIDSADPAPAAGGSAAGSSIAPSTGSAGGSSTGVMAASIAAPTSELEKSRLRLKILSESQIPDVAALQAQVQQRLRDDADMRAERSDAAAKLAPIVAEIARLDAARARSAAAPPPVDPARSALESQIKTEQSQLASLRRRYTELYPDVQEAEANLAALEARLRRMPALPPVPKLAANTEERAPLAAQENELRAQIADLDDQIASNQNAAEALRQRIASAKSLEQQLAAERQRYSTLLAVQEALDEGARPASAPAATAAPLFMMVESATSAKPVGLAFQPLYWLLSVILALLAAAFSIYLSEQFAPAVHERLPSRSFHPS